MSETQFAYGDDIVNGCQCPATAAGFPPEEADVAGLLAAKFDNIIRDELSCIDMRGVVSEAEAQEAWQEAVGQFHEVEDAKQVTLGVAIAEELGWQIDE